MNEVVNGVGRNRRAGAREAILTAIRTAEPLSRVELARITGLTEASVSTTVRRLLDEGLVVETGRTPTGGKPRVMLRLDPAARLAVGVHLDEHLTTYVLTGQTGGVIARMNAPAAADDVVGRLVADIAALTDGAGIDRARCLGIGLTRPGRPGDDLAQRLAEATGWPVLLENDATAAAVGEYWVARVDSGRPFAALYLREGDELARAAAIGLPAHSPAAPERLPLSDAHDMWSTGPALTGQVAVMADVVSRVSLVGGPYGDPVTTALVDPPQLPATFCPAAHCGSGAARHLPLVDAALDCRNTGPQAAVIQVAYLPRLSAWYQASVKSGSTDTTPLVTRSPQNCATFLPWSLARLTVTVLLPS